MNWSEHVAEKANLAEKGTAEFERRHLKPSIDLSKVKFCHFPLPSPLERAIRETIMEESKDGDT